MRRLINLTEQEWKMAREDAAKRGMTVSVYIADLLRNARLVRQLEEHERRELQLQDEARAVLWGPAPRDRE